MADKKLSEKLLRCDNQSTNEADTELLETFSKILESKLTDNQKRLLLYFLHSELLVEIKKEKQTLKRLKEKFSNNPLKTCSKNIQSITTTATELEKICELIGGILYDAVATDDATDAQIEAFTERFIHSGTWCGDSSASRKVANYLRGFKVKIDKE